MLDVSAPLSSDIHLNDDDNVSSPAPDSPNTPVNLADHADVKILSDPDALNAPSPIPLKLDPPLPPHSDPDQIIHPSADTSLEDSPGEAMEVEDAEQTQPDEASALNGVHEHTHTHSQQSSEDPLDPARPNGDFDMSQDEIPQTPIGDDAHSAGAPPSTPHTPPPASLSPPNAPSLTAVDTDLNGTSLGDDHAAEPPTKRARKFSDADRASAHTPTEAPTPAPVPPLIDARNSRKLTVAQYKFAVSTIRTLKKQKDAAPFKVPVDPVALNIPHYLQVIKHPMDLSTIERKLNSSNPAKPDPELSNPRYSNANEFIADVRLIFTNSITFNGPEHPVTLMGRRVEEVFDKQIRHLPPPEEPKPTPTKKNATPPPAPPVPAPSAKKAPSRRPSTNVPTIRRSDSEGAGRPKREIHPPPTKELPYANEPKKQRRRSVKSNASNEQLRYCGKVLDQLLSKKQHSYIVAPFAEPVDWVKLGIPDYPKIVKKPMDLGTMRTKLENGEYPNADKFRQDFMLIIKNCFEYNAPGTPVNQAGIELQHLFDEKWRGLPPLRPQVESEDDDEDEENESDVERARQIADMEAQMQSMRDSIEKMKSTSSKKTKSKEQVKKKKPAPEPAPAPVPSTSKPKKEPKATPAKKKASGKKASAIPDDDVLSFDQKKDLSDAIGTLDGTKLEKVINIIHEGVPEIRDSQEEIELEIDSLPAHVLTKLYNFVIRPMRPPPPKKARTGKGTGTGGLKRKSMDEDVEEAKIRKLEAQMRLFEAQEKGGSASAPSAPHSPTKDGHESSDSSSDDDSSGSDSE